MRKNFLSVTALTLLLFLFGIGIYELAFLPPDPTFAESENRILKERPILTLSSFLDGTFAEEIETYLSDRFPMRAKVIRISQSVRQVGSFASWDDYARVAENDIKDMEYVETFSEEEAIVTPRPTRTPSPTPTTTPEQETSESVEEEKLAMPTETSAPTPSPRPTKEPVDVSAFPRELHLYLMDGEQKSSAFIHSRNMVFQQCSLFDAYASLLPEDGVFVMTIVPNSLRASRLLTYQNPTGMTSEIEPFIHAVTANNVAAYSTADLLSKPLLDGEYVFFRTDMHWTPYGASLVVRQMLEEAGESLPPYEDFPCIQEYPFLGTLYRDTQSKQMEENPDTLDILMPTHSVQVRRYTDPNTVEEISFIQNDANPRDRYTVYLGGPGGNLTMIERTDAESEKPKTCLIITDSYGLCTAPFFAEVYDRVLLYDPRYYNKNQMGSVVNLIEQYLVTDIYMIIGELHAFDGSFFQLCNRHF